MLLRRRSDTSTSSRGQSLVEFALILPLLALLLVMAIDAGRVFFGYIGLHNAARIAANAAAADPDPWEPPTSTTGQDRYRQVVLNDLVALNCRIPPTLDADSDGRWDLNEIPNPRFENRATGFSSANVYEVGDSAIATLPCLFDLATPLATAILGQPVGITAEAEFMIRGGTINGIPIGSTPPQTGCLDKTVPNMIGQTLTDARTSWTNAGFTGAFTPATGDDTNVVTGQSTTPSSSPGDCLVETASVTVTHSSPGPCSGTDVQVPNLVSLTVAQARSTWTAAGFTGSFTPSSGSDTNIVSAQVTIPASSPGDCRPPTTTVTVTHAAPPPPQCTMPQLIGLRVNTGSSTFSTAGFTGTYTITRPPSGNYVITAQSLVAGQQYACSSGVVVAAP